MGSEILSTPPIFQSPIGMKTISTGKETDLLKTTVSDIKKVMHRNSGGEIYDFIKSIFICIWPPLIQIHFFPSGWLPALHIRKTIDIRVQYLYLQCNICIQSYGQTPRRIRLFQSLEALPIKSRSNARKFIKLGLILKKC